jgi:DNA-directed RNA polymerase subunit F
MTAVTFVLTSPGRAYVIELVSIASVTSKEVLRIMGVCPAKVLEVRIYFELLVQR